MESNIPKYDLPVDYIVGEGFAKDLLKSYKNFPCKIESGLFILCIKGTMEVTINTNTHHISENDLITLPPNCILEVHTFSSDIQIYYAGFSSFYRKYKFDESYPAPSSGNYGESDSCFISTSGL